MSSFYTDLGHLKILVPSHFVEGDYLCVVVSQRPEREWVLTPNTLRWVITSSISFPGHVYSSLRRRISEDSTSVKGKFFQISSTYENFGYLCGQPNQSELFSGSKLSM